MIDVLDVQRARAGSTLVFKNFTGEGATVRLPAPDGSPLFTVMPDDTLEVNLEVVTTLRGSLLHAGAADALSGFRHESDRLWFRRIAEDAGLTCVNDAGEA